MGKLATAWTCFKDLTISYGIPCLLQQTTIWNLKALDPGNQMASSRRFQNQVHYLRDMYGSLAIAESCWNVHGSFSKRHEFKGFIIMSRTLSWCLLSMYSILWGCSTLCSCIIMIETHQCVQILLFYSTSGFAHMNIFRCAKSKNSNLDLAHHMWAKPIVL